MNPLGKSRRLLFPWLGLLALMLASLDAAPAVAGALVKDSCNSCQVSQANVEIDPTSYKVWPSGSRTFVNAQWSPASGSASFTVRNAGIVATNAFTATAEVSDHNPLTQTPIDDMTYSYPIPPLAPGASVDVTVPLDPAQCDIFVTVDLGDGHDTVLRTGDPAAC
jgi:hypothetical protein